MLKKVSLRMRLTLLSALVMACVAVALTAVSLFSADRIFLKDLQSNLSTITTKSMPIDDSGIKASPSKSALFTSQDGEDRQDIVDPPAEGAASFSAAVRGDAEEQSEESGYTVLQITMAKAGRRFNLWGIAVLVLVTLAGAGVTWLVAGQALKPVRDLSQAIDEVGASNLSRRVDPCGRQDEVGQLAQSFNGMMDKVSASFERQKRFSASAAHELKTPLTSIQLGLEVLELDEDPSRERMEKAIAVAKTNTSRMIRLVDDLFRLSSQEECEMGEQVPVCELFTCIMGELIPQTRAKGLAVSMRALPEVELTGNRTMLYRALFNLAENAVKYNREDGSLSLEAEQDGDTVVIRVSDTGVGIPEGELEHIFEPFYRVDRSRSRAIGGAGLGLSLVKDIVENHGGCIEVESIPGEGTTFTLRFTNRQSI